MHKISDEAVQAASKRIDEYYDTPNCVGETAVRTALTSALPFLQGVKGEIIGYLNYWNADGSIEFSIDPVDDKLSACGWRSEPIHQISNGLVLTQSPRAQALEEGDLQELLLRLDHGLEHEGDALNGQIELFNIEAAEQLFADAAATIRALSSQPVADGEKEAAKTLLSGNMVKLYDACSGICKVHKFKAVLEKLASSSALPASPGASE